MGRDFHALEDIFPEPNETYKVKFNISNDNGSNDSCFSPSGTTTALCRCSISQDEAAADRIAKCERQGSPETRASSHLPGLGRESRLFLQSAE